MFERFTEKARRVIFFARYEASQYGSSSINTEHILLGLVREDSALLPRYVSISRLGTEIRADIDKVTKPGKPFPTSVEVPLSADSKKILTFAGEEADRLAHRHIGTEHILLGIFRVPDSLAAKLLLARGAKADVIREQIARSAPSFVPRSRETIDVASTQTTTDALNALNGFLAVLKRGESSQLSGFFDDRGQFIDSSGKRWIGRAEIEKGSEVLLAPFAKRNANFRVEDTTAFPSNTFVASIIWEFAAASNERSESILRMSIVLAFTGDEWAIVLVQLTPVVWA